MRWLLTTVLLIAASTAPIFAQSSKPTDPANPGDTPDVAEQLKTARVHLQKGRYGEAREASEELAEAKVEPAGVAMGLSRVHREQGRWPEARQVLEQGIKSEPDNAELWGQLAELQLLQGDYESAEKSVTEALRRDRNQPSARLVRADLYTETGRIDLANAEYRWFVRYYNRAQPRDAATLLVVARGAVQYARWNRNSQIFNFVVNTLCPDALKDDENCWQAHFISGSLLLEKYNRADALPELQEALTINPNAAEVLVSLGEAAFQQYELEEAADYAMQALEINPQLVEAHRLKAEVSLAGNQIDEAREQFQSALKVNPHDQQSLAGLAACYLLQDGLPPTRQLDELLSNLDAIDEVKLGQSTRFVQLVQDLARRNPRPGYFLTALGGALEYRRQFEAAERMYTHAMSAMPELAEPKTALGMLYMRIGKTVEAKSILDEAFRADPFHVRASNMRKVIELLDGYETITTDHFVVRVDSSVDKLLGEYVAEYLEEIYGELTGRFGFEPPFRTQFEIFNDAKGQTAHEWFSARMVGLPWIQTIGASTGVIVAMASPTAAETPFNWARVVRHEFVHVITLQQTKFNIPHWFTEALAVASEGYARPAIWNELLADRVPRGELRTLNTLNDGFARPESQLDLQFAYCQSRLYLDYIVEEHGQDSVPKLLAALRDGIAMEQAIVQVCGVELDTFEKGYRSYLNRLARGLSRSEPQAERSLAELERAFEADPEDPQTMAEYAQALLAARKRRLARKLAESALQKDPHQPLAAIVLAELDLRAQDVSSAAVHLENALDADAPDHRVLLLLAKVRLLQSQLAEAVELCELGRKRFPNEPQFVRGLAAARMRMNDTEKATAALYELTQIDPDDFAVRKQLAQLSLEKKAYADAVRFGRMALHVDVLDSETHRILGQAYLELGNAEQSIRELEVALQLSPDHNETELMLAKAQLTAGRADEAGKSLRQILSRQPDFAPAKELLDSLQR